MSSDWQVVRLEDVTSILGDGLHGTPSYDENGEYYFINGNNLGDGKIIFDEKTKRTSKDEYLKYKKNLNDRTILVSINGTIGNVGLYNGEKVILGKSACYFNVLENVDKQFVRYVVTSSNFQNYINSLATGSTIKNVSLKLMRDFAFKLPPLNEQNEISKVLEDLDNKIELNRRMNETLEAIARAIFKSWFVDFDPVRAKASGEAPESICRRLGLTPDLLALFPDRLVDSELGEIPEGWMVQSVYKVANVIYGAPFASSRFNTERAGVPLIRIRDLKDEAPGVYTEEVHPKGYMVRAGDIVVGMDGEFRAYLWGGEDAWLNQRVCVFKPTEGYSSPFVHNSIAPCLAHIEETETATTVIHLGKNDIDRFKIVAPDAAVLIAFNSLTCPLYERIVINKKELRTLAQARDALLPKLLSGEIRTTRSELEYA